MSLTQGGKGLFDELYNRVEGLRAGKPGVGQTFWVDRANGNDGWNGLRPTRDQHQHGPFATITHALTHCSGYEDDYILVLRGGGETYPIAVAVDRVHIIGITNIGTPQTVGGYLATAGAVCMTVDASHVEIAGLTFLADNANPAIELLGQCWGLWVHHCTFGQAAVTLHGIYSNVEGPVGGLIEDNTFGLDITNDGCRLRGPTRTIFRRNVFRTNTGIGIVITVGNFAEIWENRFICRNVVGSAITVAGVGGLVAHNWACFEKTDGGALAVPYTDTGTNHWSDNYVNNTRVVPA